MFVKNLTPEDMNDFNIDLVSLKNNLSDDKYSALLDESGNIDIYEVLDQYGVEFIKNEVWIQVKNENKVQYEVKAHDILSSLLYSPNQYEGCVWSRLYSHYLVLIIGVAGGQGGGVAIIDTKNKEWIFKTNEFTIEHIMWIPEKSAFVGLLNLTTYTWLSINLFIIKHTGEFAEINLAHQNYSEDQSSSNPFTLPILKKDDIINNELKDKVAMEYDSNNNLLSFHVPEHWTADWNELIKFADFKKT